MTLVPVQTVGGTRKAAPKRRAPAQTASDVPERAGLFPQMVNRREPPKRGDKGVLNALDVSPTFYTATTLVANHIAQNKWFLFDGDETTTDHPFWEVWNKPNPHMTGYVWRWLQQVYLDALDECYNVIIPTGDADQPFELWPVPPTAVTRDIDRNDNVVYKVQIGTFNETMPEESILWIRRPSAQNPMQRSRGGLGRVLGDEIELNEYVSKHIKAEFYNGARPDFVATIPEFDKDQLKAFKQDWLGIFRGVENNGEPAFLNRDINIKELSRSLKEMQAPAFRGDSDDRIRQTFCIPPELFGKIENSNRATIDAAFYLFSKVTLNPRLAFLEDAFNAQVLPLFGDTLRLEAESPVPEDKEFQLEVMEAEPRAFTVNEWRELAGKPPLSDADVYLRPSEGVDQVDAGEVIDQTQARTVEPDEPEDVGCPIIKFTDYVHTKESVTKEEADPHPDATRIAELLEPEQLQHDIEDHYRESINEWAELTLTDELGLEATEFMLHLNPFVRDHVQQWGGDEIKGINATTKGQVRNIIDAGIKSGLNPREVGRQIKADLGDYIADTIPKRSEVIARTEMLRASNYGTYEAHKISGVVQTRRWLTAIDGRQRASHGLGGMHAQEVGINEEFEIPSGFSNSGATAKYPGGFGIAEEDIQCRCGTRAVFDVDDKRPCAMHAKAQSDETIWKRFDAKLEDDEQSFAEVAAAALTRQINEFIIPAVDATFGDQEASA